jgi:hypothetical protein
LNCDAQQPETSKPGARTGQKQAEPSRSAVASIKTVSDVQARSTPELDLRQAIAAAIIAGNDAEADRLRARLKAIGRPPLRRVK